MTKDAHPKISRSAAGSTVHASIRESMSNDAKESASACPVDHKARAAWLRQAEKPQSPVASTPIISAVESCDSSQIDQTASTSSPTAPSPSHPFLRSGQSRLSVAREVSSIPRANEQAQQPTRSIANNEQETGSDKRSGNWIYPSEQMFFDAMRRKNYDPRAEDMRSIVPIHNAVNERAWRDIKDWEKGRGAEACGGPKLVSFSGTSTAMTPKARLNTLLGYKPPFDRHDWVIDRCGTRVEYVIDFYAGRDEGKAGKSLNFYLDVRPKLNSWEGWKMRIGRQFGF